jgi:hypothetical protein
MVWGRSAMANSSSRRPVAVSSRNVTVAIRITPHVVASLGEHYPRTVTFFAARAA